jgi:hypothetical protein
VTGARSPWFRRATTAPCRTARPAADRAPAFTALNGAANWGTDPQIYSGQQAAALLFGGSASDYVISTVDSNPADINFMAWYSPWGGSSPGYTSQPNGNGNFPAGVEASQSAFVDYGGTGIYDTPGDLSSYVLDWAQGPFYTNYAFEAAAVPEPASLTMLGIGAVSLMGYAWRRRKKAAA